MNIIGIRFSDNDFSSTLSAFMQAIADNGIANYNIKSKDDIVTLFNRSAPGLYWLHQNMLQHSTGQEEGEHINSYLKIERKHVYLDEEVKAYVDEHNGWDNGEFFVIDFSPYEKPYFYSI